MKLLLLRGRVPADRDPKEIMHDSIDSDDDIYTQLAYRISSDDYGEVWYWGKDRVVEYAPNFKVRWIKDFRKCIVGFNPDVVWARGGFKEYHPILKACSQSKRVYYGAGQRYLPPSGFSNYDLILQDTTTQAAVCLVKYKCRVETWLKPAADNIIKPIDCEKEYDVCYIANGTQAKIKGIKWVYNTVPYGLKVLHLGNKSKYKPPHNVTCRRVLRHEIGEWINKCRVGIIPYSSIDSNPRALVEMLACRIPVIILKDVNYGAYGAVIQATKSNFWQITTELVHSPDNAVYKYAERWYDKYASLDVVAKELKELFLSE